MGLTAYKLLLIPEGIERDDEGAERWARALPLHLGGVTRVEFDRADRAGQETYDRGRGRASPGWTIVVSLWSSAAPVSPPPGFGMIVIEVADRIGYGFENDDVGPVDGYKKMTFWKAKAGLERAQWDALYTHHIVTVPDLQPIWRYRQNVITGKPGDMPFDAVSENWWATLHDLCEGAFKSPEAKEAVFLETREFLDVTVTSSFISRTTVLFIA